MIAPIDRSWLEAHPLPSLDDAQDKDGRGRVLVVGGAEFVPGALRLTGEAALRAGAGKLQLATVGSTATALGVLVPEAAMIALPADENGEIALEAADILVERIRRCDTLVLGPGMTAGERTDLLVARLLAEPDAARSIVLDAAALTSARDLAAQVARHDGRVVLTPHHGEMARLAGLDIGQVKADPEGVAREIAQRYRCVILLKGGSTVLATPEGGLHRFEAGCIGLATSGSGDVLAGILGGLCARGAPPATAAGWACWLHGSAGRILSERVGTVGFLARDLLELIPQLLHGKDLDAVA